MRGLGLCPLLALVDAGPTHTLGGYLEMKQRGYYVDTLQAFLAADQLFLSNEQLRLDDGIPQLDCLHPSREGHNYIAGAVAAAISEP